MSSSSLGPRADMARPVCEASHALASEALSRVGHEAAAIGKRIGTVVSHRRGRDGNALRPQILVWIVVDLDRLGRRIACTLERRVARVGSLAAAMSGAEPLLRRGLRERFRRG